VDNSLDRMIATMRSYWRVMTDTADDASWIEMDGVSAAVFPRIPERSVMNSVFYERGADVSAQREALDATYRKAGVNAWTVWVPEDDHPVANSLEQGGHKLDANPAAMVLDLARLEPPVEPASDDWGPGSTIEMGAVNEAAYPFHDGSFATAAQAMDPERIRLYAARDAGRAVSVLGIHDCNGDAGVFFVATLPEARGRGLAGALIGQALAEARERGNDISTLQATKMGAPVYTRLGYRTVCDLHMWERRRS
jgi:GNAT superfamily N-acetyltransferase